MTIKINAHGFANLNTRLFQAVRDQQNPPASFLLHAEQVLNFPGLQAAIEAANSGNPAAVEALLSAVAMFRPANFRVAVELAEVLAAPHRREAAMVLARQGLSRDFADFYRTRGASDVVAAIRGARSWTPGHRPGDAAIVSVAALWRLITWAPPAQVPAAAPVAAPVAEAPRPAPTVEPPVEQTAPEAQVEAAPKPPAGVKRPRKPRSENR